MLEKLKDILWAANPRNRIWPPTHDDPRVRGPQPRIISMEAAMEMRRRQRELQGEPSSEDTRQEDS